MVFTINCVNDLLSLLLVCPVLTIDGTRCRYRVQVLAGKCLLPRDPEENLFQFINRENSHLVTEFFLDPHLYMMIEIQNISKSSGRF